MIQLTKNIIWKYVVLIIISFVTLLFELKQNVQAASSLMSQYPSIESLSQTKTPRKADFSTLETSNSANNFNFLTKISNTISWPKNNDYALEPDPDVPGGYIAYVRTPNQYLHAIYGYSTTGDTNPYNYDDLSTSPYNTRDSNITKIVLMNNIDLVNTQEKSDSNPAIKVPTANTPVPIWSKILSSVAASPSATKYSRGAVDGTLAINRRPSNNTLTIDANNHYINVGNLNIRTKKDIPITICLENATIYNSSYYGFIRGYGTTTEIYKNVNYFGAQFLFSRGNVNIETYGTINAFSLRFYYVPNDNKQYICQGNGNQQNMQAQNVDFGENCIYNGYTYSGNVLELTGSATVHNGATVNLYPHTIASMPSGMGTNVGSNPENSYGKNTAGGLYLKGGATDEEAEPVLKIEKNATLNVKTNLNSFKSEVNKIQPGVIKNAADDDPMKGGYATPGTALILKDKTSKIQYADHSNSEINLTSEGPLSEYGLAYVQGGVVDIGEGSLVAKANNLGSTSANLIQLGSDGQVFINKNGTFNVAAPDATGVVNMVYSSGNTFKVNVYKPKSLKMTRPNKDSNIIFGNGTVELHGVKQIFDSTTAIPFQYLNFPFSGNHILAASLQAQTGKQYAALLQRELNKLVDMSNQSQFNQFDSINFTAIDNGPQLNKNLSTLDPQQRKITGKVTDIESGEPMTDARVHVVLKRANSATAIDLGDKGNNKDPLDGKLDAVYLKDINTALTQTDLTAVVPDKDTWFADHHDEQGVVLNTLTGPGSELTLPWRYINDAQVISWDKNEFTIDIDQLVKNYDAQHKQKIGRLVPSDKIQVTVVNNYQASATRDISISSLYLQLDQQKARKYYLLGDDIEIPLIYQDNLPQDNQSTNKMLNVKGYINPIGASLDPKAADVNDQLTAINDNKLRKTVWKIPAQPTNKVTADAKDYTIKFYGTDESGSQSPTNAFNEQGQLIPKYLLSYSYKVFNVPGYSGYKQLWQKNNLHFSNEPGFTNPDNLGMGKYQEKNFFKPKEESATISNVTFTRGDPGTDDYDSPEIKADPQVKVIATDKNNNSQTKSFSFKNNMLKLGPKDFPELASEGHFNSGIRFEVDTNVQVLKAAKGLNLSSMHMSTEYQHPDNTLESLALGESGAIKIGNVYNLQLMIPSKIDFGQHLLGKFVTKDYPIVNKEEVRNSLNLTYTPIAKNNLKVTIQLRENNTDNPLTKWLLYKDPATGMEQNLLAETTIFNDTVPDVITSNEDVHRQLTTSWWNNKDQQVGGMFLRTNKDQPHWGKFDTIADWTVTNSI